MDGLQIGHTHQPRAADAGGAGQKGQGPADEADEGEDEPRRADGVVIPQLLGLAGLDQAHNAQDDGEDGGVAEKPKNHRDDPQHQAGGGVVFSGGIVVLRHRDASFLGG